jgi:hypothetical protein
MERGEFCSEIEDPIQRTADGGARGEVRRDRKIFFEW